MKASQKILVILITLVLSLVMFANPSDVHVSAAPAAQSGDTSFQVYVPLLFQPQTVIIDLDEPNDTRATAGGPLLCGQTHTFDLGSENDHDWYYFDTSTLGKIQILMSEYNGPNTDMALELFDAVGRPASRSWTANYLQPYERIEFLPISTGRYYIHVYRAAGISVPGQTYKLNLTCNQKFDGSGEITGVFRNKGLPAANVPATLKIWETGVNTVHTIETMTDANGSYSFWGMPALNENQTYETQFNNWSDQLGLNYAGFASKKDIEVYTAGSVHELTDLDISPITLLSPNSTTSQPLPITFTWVARTTSPLETYNITIRSISGVYQQWVGPLLGHTDSLLIDEYDINSFLDPNVTYNWIVSGYQAGDFVQSLPFKVNFSGDWE